MYKQPRIVTKKNIPRSAKRKDILPVSLMELFVVRHPQAKGTDFKKTEEWKKFLAKLSGAEEWVYWPEENKAIRMLPEELYLELRTARNRNLITAEEQAAYRDCRIGVAGLSVGSSIVSSLALTGGPREMKIADFDTLEPTNLNRIRAGLTDIGERKINLAARDVWKVDPFAKLELYSDGLTETSIQSFLLGRKPLDIFIDEMDNLALKVLARKIAKKAKIPVLMATDNADGILLDVERYDQNPRYPIFHGLVGNLSVAAAKKLRGPSWIATVEKILGGPWMPPRHKAMLAEVGKTLAGVAQLGTDAQLAGAAVSLAVRMIANDEDLPSGRYVLDMHNVLSKSAL
jgi:molybdopterin/thiamine biosynthesis adenylyltransferase